MWDEKLPRTAEFEGPIGFPVEVVHMNTDVSQGSSITQGEWGTY